MVEDLDHNNKAAMDEAEKAYTVVIRTSTLLLIALSFPLPSRADIYIYVYIYICVCVKFSHGAAQ